MQGFRAFPLYEFIPCLVFIAGEEADRIFLFHSRVRICMYTVDEEIRYQDSDRYPRELISPFGGSFSKSSTSLIWRDMEVDSYEDG